MDQTSVLSFKFPDCSISYKNESFIITALVHVKQTYRAFVVRFGQQSKSKISYLNLDCIFL